MALPLIAYPTVVALETGVAAVTVNVEVPPLRMLVGDAVKLTDGCEDGVAVGVAVGDGVGVPVGVGVGLGVADELNAL